VDFDSFRQKFANRPDNERKWADAFCDTLDGVFDDEAYQSKSKACSLFYGKGNGLSKAQFYRKKKYVVELYKWLHEQEKVTQQFVDYVAGLKLEDVVSGAELDFYYSESFDAALNFVRFVGSEYGLRQDDDLLFIKAFLVLSWNSVDIKEMALMRKSDLKKDTKAVNVRGDEPRSVALNDRCFSILANFAAQNAYCGFPMQQERTYRSSHYLFRSSNKERMTEDNIRCSIKSFNKEAKQYGHVLAPTALKKNGLFCTVLEQDKGEQSINSLLIPLCKNRQMAFGYAGFYQAWKEKYHNEA
jgi:hypothetical protein